MLTWGAGAGTQCIAVDFSWTTFKRIVDIGGTHLPSAAAAYFLTLACVYNALLLST